MKKLHFDVSYLGVDYGERHVGVALAQGGLAQPLTTVDRDQALQTIKQLLKKHQIEAIIVGDCPTGFLDELSKLAVPVHVADETLSSRDAVQSLLHTSRSRRKNLEHEAAAAIILQEWLDQSRDMNT